MTVTKVDAALDNFEDLFASHFAAADGGGGSSNAVKLLLFLADREPSSNLTWCPGNYPNPLPLPPICCWLRANPAQIEPRAQTATWRSR
jgi:hypothetical protein